MTKYCLECKHCTLTPDEMLDDPDFHAMCNRPVESLITGNSVPLGVYCAIERTVETDRFQRGACGPTGRHWEAADGPT